MDTSKAIPALTALAHGDRLRVFRHLVAVGPEGRLAGEIARDLDIRPNTLSAQLSQLTAAGLVRAAREGRAIRYAADTDGTRALIGFLVDDCCGGRPELCAPVSGEEVRARKTDNETFTNA